MRNRILTRIILLACSLLLQLAALSFHSHAAPGDVDLSFDPGSGVNGTVNTLVIQPDGKVIIGGQFTLVRGLGRTNLARLNADGSGDSSFNPAPLDNPVYSLALQSDGKLLVGSEGYNFGLTRVNPDGSRDTNFNANAAQAIASFDPVALARVFTIVVQPDGKVFYGNETLLRLNYNGTLDSSFTAELTGYAYSAAVQPDGKLIMGGYFNYPGNVSAYGIVRLNANGSVDHSFDGTAASNGLFFSIVLQPDGKVLVGGSFIMDDGTNSTPIARLNANGTVDSSFAIVTGSGGFTYQHPVFAIALQSNGKIIFGGQFASINGQSRTNLARLNPDGSLDLTFQNGAVGVSGQPSAGTTVNAVVLRTNGTMVIGGAFTKVNGIHRNRVARLDANGSLDSSLDPGRGLDAPVSSLMAQPDGKALILSGGKLARLNANGSPDETFNPSVNSEIVAFALQPNGKVIIGGSFNAATGTAIGRLNSDGGLDTYFSANITALVPYDDIPSPYGGDHSTAVTTLRLQSDGKILVGGYNLRLITGDGVYAVDMRYFVVRFLANGDGDPAFTPWIGELTDGEPYWFYRWDSYPVSALALQPAGGIVLSGQFYSVNDTNLSGIARLNANGTRDNTFSPGIGRYASVTSLASQSDGRLLMSGSFGVVSGTNRTGIWRLQANGGVDNTFNAITGPNALVSAFVLQPDGKVLIGGSFTNVNGTNSSAVARLDSSGRLDSGFHPATASSVDSLALQPDGNALMGGGFIAVNGTVRPYLARLYGDFITPSLNIARSNTFAILSWPTNALNFQLQESTNLSFPNTWGLTGQSSVTNGGQISVTVPVSAGPKVFRLKSR